MTENDSTVAVNPYALMDTIAKFDTLKNQYKNMAKEHERLRDLEALVKDFVDGDSGITPEEQLTTIKKVLNQSVEEYEKEWGSIPVVIKYQDPNVYLTAVASDLVKISKSTKKLIL